MRLKETGALKPLHPFSNLVPGDRSSANLPRPQSHGGEQGWLTCPVRLRTWHRLSCHHCLHSMHERDLQGHKREEIVCRRVSHCVHLELALVWSKGTAVECTGDHKRLLDRFCLSSQQRTLVVQVNLLHT